MPIKPLDRLLYAQGGKCFFCEQPLPKSEASVEHLFATGNGGPNTDDNCVACCKAINSLMGRMSLKEKIKVVLNQKGEFKCPNSAASQAPVKPKAKLSAPAKLASDQLGLVIENLKQRGKSRPKTLKTLTSSVASLFIGISEAELNSLLAQLQRTGVVTVSENKLTYVL